ncbi:MAG TPA: hypothetical protein VFV58_17030 [Blastocatellia bacterium]|nr:hypothetical protein [Blastocatellia bacterium]
MSYYGYFIIVFGLVIGYGYFFYRRAQAQKAGGEEAYARAKLKKFFQLPEDENVVAAWVGVTIPKLSKGQKVAEVASGIFAAIGGVGVQYVGRPLGIACTTGNRVLILDKEDKFVRAFGPTPRPRFVDTGEKGSKRPSHTRFGWDAGAILRLEIPGEESLEIDTRAAAVPVLVGWSRGEDVSRLNGPIPPYETIAQKQFR